MIKVALEESYLGFGNKEIFTMSPPGFVLTDSEKDQSDSFTSAIVPEFRFEPNIRIIEEKMTIRATTIIRTHYTSKIIQALDYLSENQTGEEDSLPQMYNLFKNLKIYTEEYFSDPFASFLSALYDGLVFEDFWQLIKPETYKRIAEIVKSLNNNSNLDYEKIDKKIDELEKLGIDTTPF